MRLSLVIAAHNEGDCLSRTVASCIETCAGLDYERVVADDASWDGSVEETQARFPRIRVIRHDERKGASPTKDLGASHARGEVLVFLDGHTKPEPGAIQRLVEDVETLNGNAIITPAVAGLCTERWKTLKHQIGHGYFVELERFDCGWLPLTRLKKHSHRGKDFYESPALIGCALAIHRELYDDLRGFDPHMRSWGVEDLDFGLKSWLMGHPILHDPRAIVGHRFRKSFDNFSVPVEHLLLNQLRMARKNFTHGVWAEWLERCRTRQNHNLAEHPEGLWANVWELFEEQRASVEAERSYLMARRVRDELWYAERFGLRWPKLQSDESHAVSAARSALIQASASPSPSPSDGPNPSDAPPPPDGCCPSEDIWEWSNIMQTNCWYHIKSNGEIDLSAPTLTLKDDGAIWELVPTALTDGLPNTTLDNPPRGPRFNEPRELNTIATKCLFGDFNLRLKFRCPNRRTTWSEGVDCGDGLKGIRNWGNSGIYIFDLYEVQICDSYNDITSGGTNVGWAGSGLYDPSNKIALCGRPTMTENKSLIHAASLAA